jgi:S-(hydroxymethyl)glutathione dehydrogenase/alcohol dehydrogenase
MMAANGGLIVKTRAAIVESKDAPLRIEEVDLSDPGPGQVRIKVEACGICRSDIHAIEGGESVRFPAVLGHEAAGVVDAIGPGVEGLTEGDRVILSWTPACGECPPCQRGEIQLCRGLRMSADPGGPMSWNGQDLDRFMLLGAFSEYVVVPEKMAVRIRGEIPATHACLIGCGVMTGFGAAVKTADVRWGESVAVIGCGGVGLSAIQGARIAGASRIFAVDPIEERRQAACEAGASDAVDVAEAIPSIVQATGGGVDAAIECVGRSQTMVDAFNMIRPGGRAVVVGLASRADMFSIPSIMLLTEKSIKGSIYGSANPAVDFPRLVALYEEGRLDLSGMVSKTRLLEEINEAIAEMREGKVARVVVTF